LLLPVHGFETLVSGTMSAGHSTDHISAAAKNPFVYM